jgi:hypothetical protein
VAPPIQTGKLVFYDYPEAEKEMTWNIFRDHSEECFRVKRYNAYHIFEKEDGITSLTPNKNEDEGFYRIFAASDFFSDRIIK